jgi:hypothetical protein
VKNIGHMTQAEVAAFVCNSLALQGIRVVLSGGAAVAIYTENRYVSQDVDLVNAYQVRQSALGEHMKSLGFVEHGRYFRHPESATLVEFPSGPLAVGGEPVEEVRSLEFSTGVLQLVSPTDCIKDRLAAFYHWGDRQALTQAILVAAHQSFDLDELARWSKAEGHASAFRTFRDGLATRPAP